MGPVRLHPLVLRLSPGRGVLVDCFHSQIVVSPEVLEKARQHAGIVALHGRGLLGTQFTVTAANGEAIYELTDRCLLADGHNTRAWVATRKAWKLKLAGEPVEVVTYGLSDLPSLFELWPMAAALKAEVMEPPEGWWKQVAWLGDVVTFSADGCEATYRVFGRHPGHDNPPVYVVQRERLSTPNRTEVTLPPARLTSTTSF